MRRVLPIALLGLSLIAPLAGCRAIHASADLPPTPLEDVFVSADIASPLDVEADTTPDVVTSRCERTGATAAGFSPGPYGPRRGDVAADFTIARPDGPEWQLSDVFDGCEVIVVLVDTIPTSALDATSVWDDPGALQRLVGASPLDVHYVFVSNDKDKAAAAERIAAMQDRVRAVVDDLDATIAESWAVRLHVSAVRAQDMDSWLGAALTSHLRTGLAIDRDQRIHGVGSLADVGRYDPALQQAEAWPWENDLAYAAHEARYLFADHDATAALAATSAVSLALFDGETLSQRAEVDVEMPADVSGFDSLQVEVTMTCPDPDAHEFESCGPWDYLARLYVRDDEGQDVEIARFITSYGRETHWIVDATVALPLLRSGGTRHFTWDFAPEWNPQPTATRISLHFADQDRGIHPTRLVPLFTGGPFGAGYNEREPLTVDIPATARHVELWSLITGHGAATAQCAEFCPHQHVFTVNGQWYLTAFAEANDDEGCIDRVGDGMVPNQGGTWWFGRGGWCPGAAVRPWVVDVSTEVVPGEPATLTYKGQLAGTDPPDDAGEIVLSSYLLIWE